MQAIKYKALVETEIICSENKKHTYEVIKKLKGIDGDKAYIVLLYPTRTLDNIYSEDCTLNHLVSHMNELGLNEIRIINLFSGVVNGGRLSAKNLKVDDDNIKYIEDIMKEKNFKDYKFIVAWGNSMTTSYACQKSKIEILDLLKKYSDNSKVYQLNIKGNNINVDFAHPLYLGIRAKNSIWRLEEQKINQRILKVREIKSNKGTVNESCTG